MANAPAKYTFDLFTINGTIVSGQHLEGDTVKGQNAIEISRKGLGPGIYFYNLNSTNDITWSGRIMVK